MRIRIDDPELLLDLRDHLRGVGCIAFEVSGDTLQVAVADAPTAAQERRELEAYAKTWTARRGVDVAVFDESG